MSWLFWTEADLQSATAGGEEGSVCKIWRSWQGDAGVMANWRMRRLVSSRTVRVVAAQDRKARAKQEAADWAAAESSGREGVPMRVMSPQDSGADDTAPLSSWGGG